MTNSPDSDNGILEDFISLFYPRYCRACLRSLVKGEDLICTQCLLEMPKSYYHLEQDNPFFRKFRGRLPVKHVMTLYKFVKQSRVQQVLHALKYKQQPEIGEMLGRVYGNDLLEADYKTSFDLIVPVPLHISRRRIRGYNQSEEFGKGLSQILGVPCDDSYMARTEKSETQTHKTRLSRWENVARIFKVIDPEPIAEKRILLVDDVVTTGATLEACGAALLGAGCRELSIACIAATQ
ncbi:MAG TPA: ComF family protein [Chryseosolibacter sp.]|nr:ComF family protein [Chryseosolibacter sp.]